MNQSEIRPEVDKLLQLANIFDWIQEKHTKPGYAKYLLKMYWSVILL
jgi:hypothetical protein